ncbi:MAG: protein-glutamate O-methyltransferase [Chromatiales bacterium]|nr:protein-glutamate O-methyltransferase [Chromatiales bacterium]
MSEKQREFAFTQRDFDFLRTVANQRTGIVVTDEKFDMFYSRLSRRVRALGLKSFSQYCDVIRTEQDDNEVLELVNAITTNLTSFFRENHHFEYLANTLIPHLLERNAASRTIRIWSAGCSTGEEPYSLAMTLKESVPTDWKIELLATDIDSNVLAKAASGIYQLERVSGIPKTRLRRWFVKGKGKQAGYVRLKPEVRNMIKFGQLNLMEGWSMDAKFDVIFCRNVIIYFDKTSKTQLVNRYADSLTGDGHLFIGHSESLFKVTERFHLIGNTIYQRTGP